MTRTMTPTLLNNLSFLVAPCGEKSAIAVEDAVGNRGLSRDFASQQYHRGRNYYKTISWNIYFPWGPRHTN